MIFARGVTVEQTPEERDERNALELRTAAGILAVIVRAEQRLEAVRVAKRFRGQRRNDLAETNVTVGERVRLSLGAEEDRADHRRAPTDWHDDDRADVPHVERGTGVLQQGVVRRVRNEHRVPG